MRLSRPKKLQLAIGLVLSSVLAFSMVFSACIQPAQAPESITREVTNLDGSVINVPTEVNRVVALFGSAYEKITLLGAEDKIIMCSDFMKSADEGGWPWFKKLVKRIDDVPPIEGVPWEPNVEEMLKLNPDVVFFWSDPDPLNAMLNAGIPVVYPTDRIGQYVSDIKDFLRVYAEALGPEEEAVADKYDAYFDEKLEMVTDVTSQIPESECPRVYFAKGKTLTTSGAGSFIPELVELAGGNCVHKDLPGGFGREDITLEQLLVWDPEFIIIDHAAADEDPAFHSGQAETFLYSMVNDQRFSNISAVKNGNVYISPSGAHYWDGSNELILQLMWLAQMFHPDKFPNLDIKAEMKNYYSEFFGVTLTDSELDLMLKHLPPED